MPLTEKGRSIMEAMKEQYGERGEEVFYRSKNAGTITGVDEMNENPEDCGDQELSPLRPDGVFGGVVDQTPVTQPVPEPATEHPQLHPDASAPPEPALGARDAAVGYGGIAGGVIPQEFGDALPTAVNLNELCRQGEQFWGPQWGTK